MTRIRTVVVIAVAFAFGFVPLVLGAGSVASAQTKAKAAIADAVAKLQGGQYLEAVLASRRAVTATGKVLRAAVKQTGQ